MPLTPPDLPGSADSPASPFDRALALALAGEREAALRWAAAIVLHDPAMPSALLLVGRLLGEAGRKPAAVEACTLAVERAKDFESLPLAVVAAREAQRFGGNASALIDGIAAAFCKESPRHGEGALPPPPLPNVAEVHPLGSALAGPALLGKAVDVVREAKARFEAEHTRPGIAALPLYGALDKEGLAALCHALEPMWLGRGERVIEQGATDGRAYFLARGGAEVRRRRAGAEELVLATLSNGAVFGEMTLVSRAPRSASVVTSRPSLVLSVTRAALESIAAKEPAVGAELASHCRARMLQNLARGVGLVASVPTDLRPLLLANAATRTFERGEKLAAQGEVAARALVVVSGEVEVVRREVSGEATRLGRLGPGDAVGESSLVLRRAAAADAIAAHPTVALEIGAQGLLELAEEHPRVLLALYKLALERDEATQKALAAEPEEAADFDLV